LSNVDGASASLKHEVTAALQDGIDRHVFPGAVACLATAADAIVIPCGRETYDPAAPAIREDSIFDVASLTKVVATATAVMQVVERGELSLLDRACQFIPELSGKSKEDITIGHLLAHMAGFPGGVMPLHKRHRTRAELLRAIFSIDLLFRPGTNRVYDDLSYILLGEIVERVARVPLDAYCATNIFQPLNMADTMFAPPERLRERIVPTEIDPDRGGLLRGVVHDENAYAMGGVAGHAGLFSTAADLARFCKMVLGDRRALSGPVISDASIRLMGSPQWRDDDGEYGFGFDRMRPIFMDGIDDLDALGHTGFTGVSLVISPRRSFALILLSNRVHPVRSDPAAIHAMRRRVVRLAVASFT
jgi:CubicO group peptidase (beta-lactamase class C family)